MDELERLQAKLGDRYKLVRELGHGGMALVYLGEDRKLHRPVAVKVLRGDIGSAVGSDRFLREIEIAANLQHPGILPVFDSGVADGLLYYVMPYVEGESLRQRLEREGPLPPEEAVRLAREVADALDHAHKHGVVHRDIKPENILLEEGHAVVADFGIARAINEASDERLTISGHAVGTPAYMSPQQAGGDRDLDGRSDIYSLSCVLFEMLTGRPPFTGPTAQAVLSGHMLHPPPSITETAPHVPALLAAAVDRGLSKAPNDRFQTPSEFSTALELPVEVSVDNHRRLSPRARLTAGVVATALLGLGAVAIAYIFKQPGLDPNRVLVFPLVKDETETSLAGDGRTAAIAIEIALDQTNPLRWVDGWDRLPEQVRRDPLLLTADLARRIAVERRAAYYIDGVLTSERDSLSVLLKLHDVLADDVVETATASRPADRTTVAALGLRAVVGLLPSLVDPGRESVLPILAGRDPGAIALCIQGEREYRLAHYGGALGLYERALVQDSLLALAAMKGALAAAWEHDDDRGKELIEAAVAYDTLLSARYAHLAYGIEAYFTGDADLAVQECREALSYDSLWTEALTWLGEVYYHLLPSEANLDSLAAAYFDRAAELDSGFVPSFMHLADIALVNAEVERAEAAIQRLHAVSGLRSESALRLGIIVDCVRNGPEAISWAEATREHSQAVVMAAKGLAVKAAHPDCAEEGFRAVLGHADASPADKWGAVLGLQGLLVAQGRNDEALALLDSVLASGVSKVNLLYVIDYLAGAPFEARASATAALGRRLFGNHYGDASSETRWAMGVRHARARDVGEVATLAQSVEAMAQESGSRRDRLLADALAGHLALVRGDTLEAIDRFETLKPTAPPDSLQWYFPESLAVERLTLAELLLARGDYQRAHDVATIFDHPQPIIYLPFLAPSLAMRLRAAVALGDEVLADRYRERLEALGRSDLVPPGT